jgi:hypothetical protein
LIAHGGHNGAVIAERKPSPCRRSAHHAPRPRASCMKSTCRCSSGLDQRRTTHKRSSVGHCYCRCADSGWSLQGFSNVCYCLDGSLHILWLWPVPSEVPSLHLFASIAVRLGFFRCSPVLVLPGLQYANLDIRLPALRVTLLFDCVRRTYDALPLRLGFCTEGRIQSCSWRARYSVETTASNRRIAHMAPVRNQTICHEQASANRATDLGCR